MPTGKALKFKERKSKNFGGCAYANLNLILAKFNVTCLKGMNNCFLVVLRFTDVY
jgi:hypothetical protein